MRFVSNALEQKHPITRARENDGVGSTRHPHLFKFLGQAADRDIDACLLKCSLGSVDLGKPTIDYQEAGWVRKALAFGFAFLGWCRQPLEAARHDLPNCFRVVPCVADGKLAVVLAPGNAILKNHHGGNRVVPS